MKMYGMTSDVDLKIKKVSEGSIIFDIFIDLVANNVVELFSNDIHLYLDFLLVVNKTLYNTIISENILNGYISLEHFVAKHPVAYDVAKRIGGGIISFFVAAKVIKNTTININTPLISINQNVNITKNQAQYIQKSIEK
ncbi:MAG: hypothetical protein LBH46_01630 [Rickettsiales bacterium]|jgi:hypothetical protein|nr:hypothetical protein [Rickettsiales bacterium]